MGVFAVREWWFVTLESTLLNWLPLIGGFSGLGLLFYMAGMLYYARRKELEIIELRVQQARTDGKIDALLLIVGGRGDRVAGDAKENGSESSDNNK